ncbi:putative isomerase YddE [Legionella massiliensis]|uniref:Putative isomerase YddE n=1 Tax=Legionella massiliensis TaxID=1034943 RepID=A0A078L0L2_9GAMM|nr:PhzF family phenazine biosynthesis isomerase [Legionella massiliensis]CDZ77543.1 putative isomerase YddE [Legionella massiliensis]CEE13281.1 putative isomerase YddE [Legionella massiliensis]
MNSMVKVDAFIGHNLLGNPAAVSISQDPIDSEACQAIAIENQLPVTAFVSLLDDKFYIRWFTPLSELPLCGHGTLAASSVIFQKKLNKAAEISFYSPKAGELKARQEGELVFINFPEKPLTLISCPSDLAVGLAGLQAKAVYDAGDRLLVILENAQQVKDLKPKIEILKNLAHPGIVVSAPGDEVDFVSRTFYPNKPNWEDAVTGASHCALVPYWSQQLKKERLHALQVSSRGGELFCVKQAERVLIGGRCCLF